MATLTAETVLAVEGLSKSFPGVQALADVSFDLRRGEVHVLLGENGAGKSTLIKILSGIYRPDRGVIALDGRPIVLADPRSAQSHGIATIHQETTLVPHLSVAENIFLGRLPRLPAAPIVVDLAAMQRRARRLLDALGVRIDTRVRIAQLTTAQGKLIEIARALCWNARILIMDEPTATLGSEEVDRLFVIIRRLREQGASVIYISHRLDELRRIGDRVTVLRDGGRVGTEQVGETTEGQLIRMMVGRSVGEIFPTRSEAPGRELLSVSHLTRAGSFVDVSLSVRAGEIVGVAGLIGSGRTELLQAIFGALKCESGQVLLHGRSAIFRSPTAAIRNGVSLLPADRKGQGLVLVLPVSHNITLSALRRIARFSVLRLRREQAVAREYVAQFSIRTPHVQTQARFLSGGNQQKILLARALYSRASVFLFDEPTFGVDIGARVEIYRLLAELTRQGAGILMVSSDTPELIGMCDRIIVMRGGRVVAEFGREEATQETIVRHAAWGASDA
jgi:ribose transport system ATP-binding protein